MKRADLLLKIIAAAEGEPLTPAQLQKVAFLLGMAYKDLLPDDYYEFQKYDYGPFCADVYRDAEALEREGKVYITINRRGGWREYAATVRGYKTDLEDVPGDMSAFIKGKVTWARGLTFQQLVRAIYQDFPDFRENSVFQDW
ncbi:MAG: hypothetical protein OXI34_04630 [Chloroflexota bacterium]|nr:hypothetical protein [Chloroflexota bacterium]MDE2854086.1 hypothetical protein [Chloroflexota bacterium]MDE2946946.1 hypothetical protein [Chloroflexota bacterium]